ncbi:pyridoxamine 5'-phosphate oxidase [Pelagibius marinus]|uniref:pyridoxamine 5'-phosphate oxidase n=1 Tax=Pelagibius marinus TaxID=2762760 RepID=UPI003F5864BF
MRSDRPADPLAIFAAWLAEAETSEPNDANAMALSTVGSDGMPSCRMVLLKGYDDAGFVFYTNFESRKGRQLLATPKAALLFHWKSLRRQVRIEGEVAPVSDAEADEYFASRHKQSQIGAWASQQSRPLEGRFELEKRVALYAAKYAVTQVPRPPHWSGFRLTPRLIEFWQDGAFRLHDRLVYTRRDSGAGDSWTTERLYP